MGLKIVGVVAALVLAVSACGGSDDSEAGGDEGADRQAVIDWMLEQGETQESAECFADELEGYSAEDFEEFEASETAEDLPEGMAADVLAAAAACVVE